MAELGLIITVFYSLFGKSNIEYPLCTRPWCSDILLKFLWRMSHKQWHHHLPPLVGINSWYLPAWDLSQWLAESPAPGGKGKAEGGERLEFSEVSTSLQRSVGCPSAGPHIDPAGTSHSLCHGILASRAGTSWMIAKPSEVCHHS